MMFALLLRKYFLINKETKKNITNRQTIHYKPFLDDNVSGQITRIFSKKNGTNINLEHLG